MKDKLVRLLESLSSRISLHSSDDSFDPLTASLKCERINALRWLSACDLYPRVYWCSRDGEFEIAGCGAAWSTADSDLSRFDHLFDQIGSVLGSSSTEDPLHMLSSVAFDPEQPRDRSWQAYPSLWLLLPRIAYVRRGDDCRLVANSLAGHGVELREDIQTIVAAGATQKDRGSPVENRELPAIITRHDLPDHEGWMDMVNTTLSEIDRGAIEKAVLARRSEFDLSGPLDHARYLESLLEVNRYSYGFLFEPQPNTAFVAASPERLFCLDGESLHTEALAGTISRFNGSSNDSDMERRLLNSLKDRAEQRYVIDSLVENLDPISKRLRVAPEPEVIRLAQVMHLRSVISAELNPRVGAGLVLRALHPSAAVCGMPRAGAKQLIRNLEPFDRGWYAGAVGCLSRERNEFAVAIRSALIRESTVSLFVGAGIVSRSDPELEWQELEQKLATGLQLLSGVPA